VGGAPKHRVVYLLGIMVHNFDADRWNGSVLLLKKTFSIPAFGFPRDIMRI